MDSTRYIVSKDLSFPASWAVGDNMEWVLFHTAGGSLMELAIDFIPSSSSGLDPLGFTVALVIDSEFLTYESYDAKYWQTFVLKPDIQLGGDMKPLSMILNFYEATPADFERITITAALAENDKDPFAGTQLEGSNG